jgi:hypothetical protein
MQTTGKFYTTRRYRNADQACEPMFTACRMRKVVSIDFGKPGATEFIRFEMTADEARNMAESLLMMADSISA